MSLSCRFPAGKTGHFLLFSTEFAPLRTCFYAPLRVPADVVLELLHVNPPNLYPPPLPTQHTADDVSAEKCPGLKRKKPRNCRGTSVVSTYGKTHNTEAHTQINTHSLDCPSVPPATHLDVSPGHGEQVVGFRHGAELRAPGAPQQKPCVLLSE